MGAEKLVAAAERFFFDVLGGVIPGAILLAGGLYMGGWMSGLDLPAPEELSGWLFIVFAYPLGHALTTIGFHLLERPFRWFSGDALDGPDGERERIRARGSFLTLAKHFRPTTPLKDLDVRELRNLAMSIITPEEKATVVRFTHLSLLALGTATALVLLAIPGVVAVHQTYGFRWATAFTAIFLALEWSLLTRRIEFSNRAFRVPFDIGEVALMRSSEDTVVPSAVKERQRVYLAGGHRSGWQQSVMDAAPGFDYFDPRNHGFDDPASYTIWDLAAIDQSDILFVYFEATNPSGFGLSLEVGYANAKGKMIVLVDEKSATDPSFKRYLGMLNEAATVRFSKLGDGLALLKQLQVV